MIVGSLLCQGRQCRHGYSRSREHGRWGHCRRRVALVAEVGVAHGVSVGRDTVGVVGGALVVSSAIVHFVPELHVVDDLVGVAPIRSQPISGVFSCQATATVNHKVSKVWTHA